MHCPSAPHIPHSLHIPLFVISSSQQLVSTNQEATHYTVPLHTTKQRLPQCVTQFVDNGTNTFVLFVEEGPALYCYRHTVLRSDIDLRPVWTTEENPVSTLIRSADRRSRSKSLYRLWRPFHQTFVNNMTFIGLCIVVVTEEYGVKKI